MEKSSSRPIRDNSFIPAQQTATGVNEVGEMALNFTQRNIAFSFEFAEKAVRVAVMNQIAELTAGMLVGNQQN
jgi:hypothetical protein